MDFTCMECESKLDQNHGIRYDGVLVACIGCHTVHEVVSDSDGAALCERRCAAQKDGDCFAWGYCPQLQAKEPVTSGRDCPYADWST